MSDATGLPTPSSTTIAICLFFSANLSWAVPSPFNVVFFNISTPAIPFFLYLLAFLFTLSHNEINDPPIGLENLPKNLIGLGRYYFSGDSVVSSCILPLLLLAWDCLNTFNTLDKFFIQHLLVPKLIVALITLITSLAVYLNYAIRSIKSPRYYSNHGDQGYTAYIILSLYENKFLRTTVYICAITTMFVTFARTLFMTDMLFEGFNASLTNLVPLLIFMTTFQKFYTVCDKDLNNAITQINNAPTVPHKNHKKPMISKNLTWSFDQLKKACTSFLSSTSTHVFLVTISMAAPLLFAPKTMWFLPLSVLFLLTIQPKLFNHHTDKQRGIESRSGFHYTTRNFLGAAYPKDLFDRKDNAHHESCQSWFDKRQDAQTPKREFPTWESLH